MPAVIVASVPASFSGNFDNHVLQIPLTFTIPAGTYSSAFWQRVITVTTSTEIGTGSEGIVTNSHELILPLLPSFFSGNDTTQVTTNQLADINAAAGGAPLAALYGRSGIFADTSNQQISQFSLVLIPSTAGGPAMRFERATVYEGAQIGVETTPGTAVAANKRLLGCEFMIDNMPEIKTFRPQGNKFITTAQTGKEMSSGRLNGILCFNDLLYLASSFIQKATPSVPVNNSKWNVTGASGTWGFTYKGSVLTPSAWANAAAAQAAIGALASVGVGNVLVTGTAPTYTIQFIGALSTDVSAITSPTGSPTPTIVLNTAGTLTNRWKFVMAPAGPDDIQTYSIEKGAAGVSNMAGRAAFMFLTGLSTKFSKSEASLSGEFVAQTMTDPFTMTSSPADVACVPVDMAVVDVFMGTTLINLAKMDRCLDLEFGVTNRANGLMTLNSSDPSFSNRIEVAPNLTSKFSLEHDSNGQAMLANLRAGSSIYTVVEAQGPLIETGFPYRMKWTYKQRLLKDPSGDVDGAFCHNYDSELIYDSTLGTAIQLEIDSPLSSL